MLVVAADLIPMTSCLLQKLELERLTSHKGDGLGRTLTIVLINWHPRLIVKSDENWEYSLEVPDSCRERTAFYCIYGRQAKGLSLGLMLGLRQVGVLTSCFVGEERLRII